MYIGRLPEMKTMAHIGSEQFDWGCGVARGSVR